MTVGYRNNAGMDFDSLFQAGSTQAPGFRKSDGTNLRYAARGSTPKIPNVGFRDALGSDLSNLWMARSTAPPVPGFNGKTYVAVAQALTNATGQTTATASLVMRANGTWEALSLTVNTATPGVEVLDSGVWLPAGSVAADFTIRFSVGSGSGQGVVSNSAPSAVSLAANQNVQLFTEVPASSGLIVEDARLVTATLTRVGSGASVATFTLVSQSAGWR